MLFRVRIYITLYIRTNISSLERNWNSPGILSKLRHQKRRASFLFSSRQKIFGLRRSAAESIRDYSHDQLWFRNVLCVNTDIPRVFYIIFNQRVHFALSLNSISNNEEKFQLNNSEDHITDSQTPLEIFYHKSYI